MNIFLYVIIFIIGIFFGSFFTLAIYRIPRKEDILIKHSYCPNCNHKLGFFDLFPVLSYIFLRGKCKYCKNKIRPRYLILELLSGFTFLILTISMKITNLTGILELFILLIYIAVLFIIAGIDKENIKIQKDVIIFGYIIELIYIIYQYTLGIFNVYQYVIYLLLLIVCLTLSNIFLRTTLEGKYYIDVLYLSLYMIIYCGSTIYIYTVLMTLLTIVIYKIISVSRNNKLPIGFYLSVSNIITIIMFNITINYII